VADPHRLYEIRCPVHGFIEINDWEREIISQPAFQRLRRIRQLAWTDMVYPGATHTRVEHSLGVMHVATKLYEAVRQRSRDLLKSELGYNDEGLGRDCALVRLTALLHDTGHGPFSHAAEDLFPLRPCSTKRFVHEEYSAAIIQTALRDVIENHPLNRNYHITVGEITALLTGSGATGERLFWRELVTGQMDADRMDYLLRDSLHAGVDYGRYDWRRLWNTVQVVLVDEGEDTSLGARLGVSEGGVHAAEALVLARYFMFTQVYFHKTRVAYNHHLRHALRELLPDGLFPPPTPERISDYLRWDDWRVLGMLADDGGGEHGRRLCQRNHYRAIYRTPETPTAADLDILMTIRGTLGAILLAEERAGKSWYKVDRTEIPVVSERAGQRVFPLSQFSPVIANLKATGSIILYTSSEDAARARELVRKVGGNA
jgi:HD superfamily phosphohydrolase